MATASTAPAQPLPRPSPPFPAAPLPPASFLLPSQGLSQALPVPGGLSREAWGKRSCTASTREQPSWSSGSASFQVAVWPWVTGLASLGLLSSSENGSDGAYLSGGAVKTKGESEYSAWQVLVVVV